MYLPIFIAILMGFLSPINQSSTRRTGVVYVKINGCVPQNTTSRTDSIPPGDGGDGGEDGPGTGGGTTQNPPPKP